MVRQFADPYAFLRELVQNSMDAGTTRIEVDLVREADGKTRTRLGDSGSGMTPAIIESALLTLFSSSKEGDSSKIGKYGVGFVSVLAVEPEAVIVDTWRDGSAWRVTILRDHSYVLEELSPRPLSGTNVTLTHTMESTAFDEHAGRVRDSLRRWCRHARVPLWLSVTDHANPQGSSRARLDTPLSVHTAVSVSEVDGDTTIVVGPGAGSEHLVASETTLPYEGVTPFVGFYNRGLTLFETSVEELPGLAGLRVKISSGLLKHTLSRDNVRRGPELDELVRRAAKLARRGLPKAVEDSLARDALAAASGEDPRAYLAVLAAATAEPLGLGADRTWFPLASPVDGEAAMTASEIFGRTGWREPVLTATERDELTAAFAETGRPVVLCPSADVVRSLARLRGGKQRGVEPAYERHMLVSELGVTAQRPTDAALAEEVRRCLAVGGSPATRVAFARVYGTPPSGLVVASEPVSGIVSSEEAARARARWGKRAVLLLDDRFGAASVARDRAGRELRAAAHLLARLVLLERRGPLTARLNDALARDYARNAR
jgi:molecular chaperone HtpG